MIAGDPIVIADWSPQWSRDFTAKSAPIRDALGPLALRIDHIGSTSVPGLAAKPIIDMQVSVADFEPIEHLAAQMALAGYAWKSSNPEMTKRYFRERPGAQRTHIHVRRLGSWHEQWALLFRDFMRSHPEEHGPYVAVKRTLAQRYPDDTNAYTDGKDDHFWSVIRRANGWAADTGWRPGPSDA